MHVLVVRLSAMGDVVHGIAAVRALQAARSDLRVSWVVQRPFAPLLEGLGFECVVALDRAGGPRAFLRTARALRALHADVALDLQGNWKSAALALLSGAKRRLGAVRDQRREPTSAWLSNETVRAASAHPDDIARALVREIAPDAGPDDRPSLVASDAECAEEREALRALGVDVARPFRVLVLADPADPRAIRPAALARETANSREPVIALVGPDDAASMVPDGAVLVRHARGELRRLVALGTLGARSGAVALGPDKGASHVLAACGLRTVVVHGPTDPARTASRAATVLRSPSPPSCMPCGKRRCTHAQGPVCTDVAQGDVGARFTHEPITPR